jgi:tetratricopeptide (TPR) repeat protein
MALGLILLGMAGLLRADDASEDQPLTPYQTALLDYKTGKYDDARTAIDAAEKANPGDLPTEILKARILTEQLQFDEANRLLRSLFEKPGTTPAMSDAVGNALGDLYLRKRSFDKAAKIYEEFLAEKPTDPDLILKIVYSLVGASDLLDAAKYASQLRPLDLDHPCYYFAKAALAQATGKAQEADDDIQTARTIYGITVTNRYLKTYLEVFASSDKSPASDMTPPNPPPK